MNIILLTLVAFTVLGFGASYRYAKLVSGRAGDCKTIGFETYQASMAGLSSFIVYQGGVLLGF